MMKALLMGNVYGGINAFCQVPTDHATAVLTGDRVPERRDGLQGIVGPSPALLGDHRDRHFIGN